MRRAVIHRHTTETHLDLALTLEGRGRYDVSTGIRFFDTCSSSSRAMVDST